ncbi:hypothetical protein ALC60_01997, partial [Trachymyrmex zeteki]
SQHPITEPGIRTRCWIVVVETRRRVHVAPGVPRHRRPRRKNRPLYLRPSYIPAPCRSPARAQGSLGRSIRPCCRRACRHPQLGPPSAHPRPGPGPLARRPPGYVVTRGEPPGQEGELRAIRHSHQSYQRHQHRHCPEWEHLRRCLLVVARITFDRYRALIYRRNKTIGLTENEAEGVSKGCLAPDQTPGVDCLGGAVDVTTADPGRRHREYPDEEPDRAAGQHDLLLGVVARFLFPGRPYSHAQDQQVEENDGNYPGDVDHFRGIGVHRRELELTET